jgi:hypothetical protein
MNDTYTLSSQQRIAALIAMRAAIVQYHQNARRDGGDYWTTRITETLDAYRALGGSSTLEEIV